MVKVTQVDLCYALEKSPFITINTYSLTCFLLTYTFRFVTYEQCFPYVMVHHKSVLVQTRKISLYSCI